MTLSQAQLSELKATPVGDTGNRVAKAIELVGETMADISRNGGFSYTWLSDVKSGRFETVTVDNAHKLADYFGCAIEDLFPAKVAA